MKFGDHVIFVEKGVEHSAIVMRASSIDATAGENGEPALELAFFAKPFVPEYRYDVRHQSFSNKGAYWKDVMNPFVPAEGTVPIPPVKVSDTTWQMHEAIHATAQSEVAKSDPEPEKE